MDPNGFLEASIRSCNWAPFCFLKFRINANPLALIVLCPQITSDFGF
jgi:hypothetical protein